jgi:hypothetical protein
MKTLDENSALAILFANIRRKKRNADLITIAKACKYLVKLYGSRQAVAKKVGLSTEMIREFLITLKLPKEIQKLVSARRIDNIDTVREISAIKVPSKQITAAKVFVNSLSKDARDVKRLIKEANAPVKDAKKTILEAKPKGWHIFVMDFDEETYRAILERAKVMKTKPAELVKEIVANWLKQRNKGEQ